MELEEKKRRRHQSGSFLVRFWVEPEAEESEQGLRGTVRNLKTGEEQHLTDPGGLGELVRQFLEEEKRAAGSTDDDGAAPPKAR